MELVANVATHHPLADDDDKANRLTLEHCANAAFLCGYDRREKSEMEKISVALSLAATGPVLKDIV